MKSLDAHYAKIALQSIQELEKSDEALKTSFGSMCHQFPSMVKLNGLRLTVAFYESKKENTTHAHYLAGLKAALGVSISENDIPERGAEYRRMTEQALRASIWFKRYAEAILICSPTSDPAREGDV
ncbi:type III-B CRISPR module-associated protein Cmr5 [Amphibacillus cookii]|uniref:type III-B CRISPR module-associated protein Cmr5 n=1 Tax=Amphibacillus cookii TaxID=767787 RepID=UPI00195A3272|nr:type III-B CRISPR module-associated protein Cmr5 [Amphibacillus cookii]MBM7541841.1 CRISPR-associated protein Cmr5 [Amphibacillus cookii]